MPQGGSGEPTVPSRADVPAELRRIATERDWDALEALCDRYWLALPDEHGEELVIALAAVPTDVLNVRPRLLVAWVTAYHLARDPDLRPYLRNSAELGTRLADAFDPATETSPATLTIVGTAVMISLRVRGELADAERLGQRLTDRLARLGPLPGRDPAPRPGWLAVQRGLTRSLMGDYAGAAEHYRRSHEQARGEPIAHFAGSNAAANLAMLFAHLGHRDAAAGWLRAMRAYPEEHERIASVLRVGGAIATGWLALDRYDRGALGAALAATDNGRSPLEVWPFATALAVTSRLHLSDPVAALADLDVIQLSHPTVHTRQGAGRQVLDRARADLLIATGEANRAQRLVTEAGTPWLTVPAARLRLLCGDHRAARALASPDHGEPFGSRRDTLQLLLIKALAALRMGDREDATRYAGAAMGLREPDEVLSLTTLSPADRVELAGLVPIPLSDVAAERLAVARTVFPQRVRLVDLTARERAVLTELATGDTAAQIASSLVVSVNTVRTQIQSIYRKLEVTSRDDALMNARELGLI